MAVFASRIAAVTIIQLAQDKFCLNTFSINKTICLNLENVPSEYDSIQNQVLEKATTIKMYMTIMTTLPGLILSIFLGYWIDNYPGHLRWLLTLSPIGWTIRNLMLIYQCVFFESEPSSIYYSIIGPAFAGNTLIAITGTYTYVARKTSPKYRAVRFAILELALFTAIPLSTNVGGVILHMEPWFDNQHRNYIGVFIISTVSAVMAALLVIIFINDIKNADSNSPPVDIHVIPNEELKTKTEHKNFKLAFLNIFSIHNVTTTFHTAFRRRENNGRFCIWITMGCMAFYLIGYQGESAIGLQYSQRVYHWNSERYSIMLASVIAVPSIVTLIIQFLATHKFNLHDTSIGIFGSFSLVIGLFIRGSVPIPIGFLVSGVLISFDGLLPIANRAIIARIIGKNEIGQIYSFLSCIEASEPLLSSVFYSKIFNATIENSPGAVFMIAGILMIFPSTILIWLNRTKMTWDWVLTNESKVNSQGTKDKCTFSVTKD